MVHMNGMSYNMKTADIVKTFNNFLPVLIILSLTNFLTLAEIIPPFSKVLGF